MPQHSSQPSGLSQAGSLELDRICEPPDSEGLDRRIRKTRQRLQAGLLLLMKEKPMGQITMREVCRTADVGRSTPYTHYRDVEDILEQMEAALYNGLASLLAQYPAQGTPAGREAWFTLFYTLARRNGLLLEVLLCHGGDAAFLSRCMALCEGQIQSAVAGSGPESEWHASFLCGALTSLLRQWVRGGCAEPPAQMAAMTVGFLGRLG